LNNPALKTATGVPTRGRFQYRKNKVTDKPMLSRDLIIFIPSKTCLPTAASVSTRDFDARTRYWSWNKKVHRANAPVTKVSLMVQSRNSFMPPQAEVCGEIDILRCPVSGIDCSALPRAHLLSVRNERKD
jgi:hypothetical protein